MAQQRFNPAQMNQKQMMNNQNMLSMQNLFQKIGKGKRKFRVVFDKNTKLFLNKFFIDYKKMMLKNGAMPPDMISFFDYTIEQSKKKDITEIYFSYEEVEFMKKIFFETLKGMENMQYKWYQFLKKFQKKFLVENCKLILKALN